MGYRDLQKLLFTLAIGIGIIMFLAPLHPAYCTAIGFFLYLLLSMTIDEIDKRKKKQV